MAGGQRFQPARSGRERPEVDVARRRIECYYVASP